MIKLLTKEEAIVHFCSLSPEDRYTRFCMTASDEYIRNYVNRDVGFFYGEVELVYPKVDMPESFKDSISVQPLVFYKPFSIAKSVVHIVHNPNDQSLEVAVSTLADAKGKGYAKRLMYFAQGMAEVYQAKRMVVSGLSQNSPMINLAKSCGYEVKSAYGEFEGSAQTIGSDLRNVADKNIKLFNIFLGRDQ